MPGSAGLAHASARARDCVPLHQRLRAPPGVCIRVRSASRMSWSAVRNSRCGTDWPVIARFISRVVDAVFSSTDTLALCARFPPDPKSRVDTVPERPVGPTRKSRAASPQQGSLMTRKRPRLLAALLGPLVIAASLVATATPASAAPLSSNAVTSSQTPSVFGQSVTLFVTLRDPARRPRARSTSSMAPHHSAVRCR